MPLCWVGWCLYSSYPLVYIVPPRSPCMQVARVLLLVEFCTQILIELEVLIAHLYWILLQVDHLSHYTTISTLILILWSHHAPAKIRSWFLFCLYSHFESTSTIGAHARHQNVCVRVWAGMHEPSTSEILCCVVWLTTPPSPMALQAIGLYCLLSSTCSLVLHGSSYHVFPSSNSLQLRLYNCYILYLPLTRRLPSSY
jgi:hypothetical protein